ncbi:MAG TPA: hypothetical protein IAC53_05840 [Candidatus Fimenecus excrementigallinarum]|uniref:Lasso peptide n=1 Tax=Candidatus Fimenecus excrementigallinarum TaxID=2840816 RepID=A0A9D1IFS6_9FIRM|nr:hypothetical protein [Candidatus Fimenecus excrementigallinarum]
MQAKSYTAPDFQTTHFDLEEDIASVSPITVGTDLIDGGNDGWIDI